MKNLTTILLIVLGTLALASCAEDGVYNSAYSSSGVNVNDAYTSSTYYPNDMNSGYNRSYYKSKQKQKIVEPSQQISSSVSRSVTTTTSSTGGSGYSSSSN